LCVKRLAGLADVPPLDGALPRSLRFPYPRCVLRFRPDGRFRIVQFTDTHFCDGSVLDRRTASLMEGVLAEERPDLVVLTGDVIDGARAGDARGAWRQATAPMVARGIPWAAVFGNHDDEGGVDRAAQLAIQRRLPGCLTRRGPRSLPGIGNFVLEIAAARTAGRTAALLYFLDSHAYSPTGAGMYAWIRHDQIAWYRRQARRRRPRDGRPLPALAFFHIPLPEYATAWELGRRRGSRHEPVFCPAVNSGLFATLHECGDVIGTFAGHDHVNDFEAELLGVRLCYGRATGYNEYGRRGFARGARVIELREGRRSFDTWLRLDRPPGRPLRVRQA
jgi:hypothetical protein